MKEVLQKLQVFGKAGVLSICGVGYSGVERKDRKEPDHEGTHSYRGI